MAEKLLERRRSKTNDNLFEDKDMFVKRVSKTAYELMQSGSRIQGIMYNDDYTNARITFE